MLNWIKDLVRPIRRIDPMFGPIRYLRDTRTWEGWIEFPSAGERVEVLLTGETSGPTDAQHMFMAQLAEKYSAIVPEVEELLRGSAAGHKPGIELSFRLVAIDLPEDPGSHTWELCFETLPPSWLYAVKMERFAPHEVTAEC